MENFLTCTGSTCREEEVYRRRDKLRASLSAWSPSRRLAGRMPEMTGTLFEVGCLEEKLKKDRNEVSQSLLFPRNESPK